MAPALLWSLKAIMSCARPGLSIIHSLQAFAERRILQELEKLQLVGAAWPDVRT
jgi:hypothetical protein